MKREDIELMVSNHNDEIDSFVNNILPQLLKMAGVEVITKENGEHEIPVDAWFKAQGFIKAMNFYESGMKILKPAREAGYDVKMDMQSHKLSIY